jgi:PAS domain S-box-containing protein
MSLPEPAKKSDDAAALPGARRKIADLESQLEEMAAHLRESEETLEAIRGGEVDAVVVAGEGGRQIYTLTNADRPYRVLIENMKEGAVTLSHDGITVYCNAAFAALVGEPPEYVVGAPFTRFLRPEDSRVFDLLFNSIHGGSVELMLVASGDIPIPAVLSFSPIADNPEGRIVCAIVTDLRERHHLKALERSQAELEHLVEERTASLLRMIEERRRGEESLRQNEKLQVIGQLTGGVAHDFNNVLQVITSGVRLMKSPRVTAERKVALLDAMEQSVNNAASVVSRLLAFGRRQALRPRSFDLNGQLRGLTELLSRTIGSKIEIQVELAPDLWPVSADPNQFEMALLNLAMNARDAMPTGGALILRTHNNTSSSEQVCVTVEDTGTGMSASVRARIFEPFFTTKGPGKGTGLGLPQVYGFAKQSGGDVLVDSAPGQGTRVTVCLPRARGDALALGMDVSDGEGQSMPAIDATGKVVLVVDDNTEVANFAAAMLEGLGYTVQQAGNAPEALARLDAGARVDAVFSDVVMPGQIDGAELASILCARHPGVAVVMATGYSEKLGPLSELPVEVLAKPYRLDDLREALGRALTKVGGGNR